MYKKAYFSLDKSCITTTTIASGDEYVFFVVILYCIWQRMTRWQYMYKSHLHQPWIHMTSNTSIVFSDIPSLYTIFQCKKYNDYFINIFFC